MKFKAGKYYIGDPCYVLGSEDYDSLYNQLFDDLGDEIDNAFCEIRGFKLFCHSTYFGDGVYFGLWVDSGTLACLPIELVDKCCSTEFGEVYDFKEDFDCSYEEGLFKFGRIELNTAGDEND